MNHQTEYLTKYDWNYFTQCDGGEKKDFFFEVFTEYGMIRTNSENSMEDAEEKAWVKYQKSHSCPLDHKGHGNLDRRHYKNGCAFCKGCGQFIASAYSGLQPTTICVKCRAPTYYGWYNKEQWHCEDCLPVMSLETGDDDVRFGCHSLHS